MWTQTTKGNQLPEPEQKPEEQEGSQWELGVKREERLWEELESKWTW